jgi:hypothetical protein
MVKDVAAGSRPRHLAGRFRIRRRKDDEKTWAGMGMGQDGGT